MTFSANDRAGDDRLSRALELYRDLSVALTERITRLKAGPADSLDARMVAEDIRAHNRVLQTVLDLEGSLGKRKTAWGEGVAGELDLDAARSEILAKLSVWAGRR